METNDSYTSKVDAGVWPENPMVPLDDPFVDARGVIQNLVLKPLTSVAVITSKGGSVRSNHYHKSDWHYIHVLSGKVLYLCRPVGSLEIPDPIVFGAGQMFFTPNMVEHAVVFPEDTVLLTMSKNVRSHESHESDLVRVQFVSQNMADALIGKL